MRVQLLCEAREALLLLARLDLDARLPQRGSGCAGGEGDDHER